MMQQRSTVD